ncbi:MAG: hypothetical protein EOM61_07770 [Bacteroidia bacterium]|nr:hypothetical protein [Bacteroidia bacterium]
MTKNFLRKLFPIVLLSLFTAALTISCTKEDKPEPEKPEPEAPDPLGVVKKYAYDLMNDIYYWYKDVPKNINPKPINTIQAYFDTLMVPVDRWSWMMTGQEYLSSESGIVETYGMSISQPIDYYNDYGVRVRYVHPSSPMADNNIKRGYQLTHLNGTSVTTLIKNGTFNQVYGQRTNSFTFNNHIGQPVTFTATAREVSTRSSLVSAVYGPQDFQGLPYNIGYFHYLSFKAGMLDDIHNAMAVFKAANVKELILDLRYNGGGDSRATTLLANYIAPASAEGKLVARREHNDRYSSNDADPSSQTIITRMSGSLDLDRLFILTTKGSASASEVILNGLKPLMNVVHIGGTTYGKPNGMYVLPYPEGNYDNPLYVFLPICFFTVNSTGYGHYVDGLVPDHYRPDDLYHDFGINDDWVNAVMNYITKGSFPALPPKPGSAFEALPSYRITTPEEQENYGTYKVELRDQKPLRSR